MAGKKSLLIERWALPNATVLALEGLLVAHGGQLVLVKAEVVAQLVDDGLADLLHDFLAAGEAALVGPLEHGDHVGDVVVVAVRALDDGQPIEQSQ